MINTKQLVELVRNAEKTATSLEHFQELLRAAGVLVGFRRDGAGKVNGWKLRPADSTETDWVKGSEITSDRSFAWAKLAARRGWLIEVPTPRSLKSEAILADEEAEEEVEETIEEHQVKTALAALVEVCSELSVQLFRTLLRFINRILDLLGIRMRLELPERAEQVSQARVRILPPTAVAAAPNYGTALRAIHAMTTSVAQNDSERMDGLLAKADENLVPAADRKAVADFLSGRAARVGRPVEVHKPAHTPAAVAQTPAERIARLKLKQADIFAERRQLKFQLIDGRTVRQPASALKIIEEKISDLTASLDSLSVQVFAEERAQMTPAELRQAQIHAEAEEVAAEEAWQREGRGG